ncbi:pantetheine-phosphate adenylyltransferase [Propionibacterium cyclohexanicum]|uniref:pantetheine-phosphate adenylyltransferase n=1 Tax=Propionibacterium cyclohexanicum TaxID=64702 RepID=UPI000B892EA1|nr:pantetheine-phosphate adenylyltransferase [Propionibacterium cyclohexanicum]
MRAVCPGSFDPITRGHLDIIERACSIFGEVIVAVGRNSTKNYLFDFEERLDLTRDAVGHLAGVVVEPIDGLLTDFCLRHEASVIVKGVRFGSDFDYELQMGQLNRILSGIETVLLPAGREYGTISSTMLREVAANHGDIGPFVTERTNAAVHAKLGY